MNTEIYIDPAELRRHFPGHRSDVPEWETIKRDPYIFRPEFLARVESETNWVAQSTPLAKIEGDHLESIGLRREVCPRCGDRGRYWVSYRGETTGIDITNCISCQCNVLRLFWYQWQKTGKRFRDVAYLQNLTPSTESLMSLKRQAEIIKTVQEHPHRSYLIYGDPGTGKTHLAASLYRSHLADWANSTGGDFAGCPIWRVSAPVLLEQWVARSTDSEAPRPDVSERSIVSVSNSGMRPVLFLDEIDKVRGSDYKMEKLRAIVDAVYEAQGQIVATSNTDPESIAAKWGGEWADIILRRIAAPPEGMVLQFQVAE